MRISDCEMNNGNNTALIVFLLLCTAAGVFAQDDAERQGLIERRDQLRSRIGKLQAEQDFLLFQKEMYAADSKYLLLDPHRRTGVLKYRDRVIRTFSFSPEGPASRLALRGAQALTARAERDGKRRILVFGNTLVLRTKHGTNAASAGPDSRHYILSSRDMDSLFYALDTGSRAYLIAR